MRNQIFLLAGFAAASLVVFANPALYAINPAPKGYAVAEINVTDPVAYNKYLAAVSPVVAQFGGKYIVRAGHIVPLEGQAPTGRYIVIEFPSMAIAQKFESSPQYRAIAPLRQRAARSRLFLVEGSPNQ
ncbi:MAG TPA: DUF1330 domain-containing protein [Terracidiphilus sp.]|jgi:uncharacterized protein (DUF1330 family)|nr:DUF1330 domain-containing protein [Terracidiphilus sp.]